MPSPAPLAGALGRLLPERPFTVEFWDGTRVPGAGPTFSLRSPRALRRMLAAPGQLGLGRAYFAGELEVDDLDAALAVVDMWKPPPLGLRERAELLAAVVRAAGVGLPPPPPSVELRPRGARHSLQRDRRAVRHHYDVGNDFFRLLLDESMTYSCAFWHEGAEALEDAQRTKLETVCRKLALEPGQRLLDIGCGWGSLIEHAVREYGVSAVGITLSDAQAALARERLGALGDGAQKAEVRVADWRELRGEHFDAVASVGMAEHVGPEHIDQYAGALRELVRPGGLVLNHAIGRLSSEYAGPGPVSDRYVFPDADPQPLSRMVEAFQRARLEPLSVSAHRTDYERTLDRWIDNLDSQLDEAIRLAGAERVRVWRLYLRAARRGFRTGFTSIYQLLGRRSFG